MVRSTGIPSDQMYSTEFGNESGDVYGQTDEYQSIRQPGPSIVSVMCTSPASICISDV